MVRLPILCTICLIACLSSAQTSDVFTMQKCTKLPVPTQMHACAVVGDRIYVMGGNTDTVWTPKVYSAPIDSGGSLGTWRSEEPLPELRAYATDSVEVVNNRIYIIAGSTAPQPTSTDAEHILQKNVIWTTVKKDGSLEPWKKTEDFIGNAASCTATCSSENHLYVVGGLSQYTGKVVNSEIRMCDLAEDGSPVKWRVARSLPLPLWYEAAAIQDSRMFVWGGLPERGPEKINNKTFSAEIREDGSIGEWRDEATMPQPVYSAASCGMNDYLISLGGRYVNAYPTNVIWVTRLVDKQVKSWTMLKTDMEARVYHSAGVDMTRGFVFVTGGQFRSGVNKEGRKVLDTVQAFRVTQPDASKLTASETKSASTASTGQQGLLEMDAALAEAKKSGRKILVFFYSPHVPASKRAFTEVIEKPEFRELTKKYIAASIDISADHQRAYQYEIFKAPSLAVINANGVVDQRLIKFSSVEDLKKIK